MSQIGPDEELQVAELRVQVPQEWNKKNELKALAVIMDGNSFIDMSSISFVTTRLASEEILIIDFTSALSDWLEFVRKNHLEDKLTLDIAFKIGNRRKSSSSSRSKLLGQVRRIRSENSNTLEAILVTYTQAGDLFGKTKSVREFNKQNEPIIPPASLDINAPKMDDDAVSGDRIQLRSKRSNFDVSDNGHENGYNCRRKELTIDFTAMGWGEWVVYPTHFNSYQCTGKCGGFTESRNNPTNHAIVQSLVRLISRNAIPMSCCTPTKLSPLSILYLEKGSVVIKHHEEMIVDECGCM